MNRTALQNLLMLSVLMLVLMVPAQAIQLGSWNLFNVRKELNSKVTVFSEVQLRSLSFYSDFHYHEAVAGAQIRVYDGAVVTLAGGKYDTYREGGTFVTPRRNNEVRFWPQLTLTQPLWHVRVEQRYRMEARFTSAGYRNRFRYRTGAIIPLNGAGRTTGALQLGVYNEVFFTNRAPYFERNRFSTALTWRWQADRSLQLGYVRQFDYKINDETGRGFLQLGLLLAL